MWSIFELMITIFDIRSSVEATIYRIDLHWVIPDIIRGSSEGAVFAIVGIIFGDYIPNQSRFKIAFSAAILLFAYFVSLTLVNSLSNKNIKLYELYGLSSYSSYVKFYKKASTLFIQYNMKQILLHLESY